LRFGVGLFFGIFRRYRLRLAMFSPIPLKFRLGGKPGIIRRRWLAPAKIAAPVSLNPAMVLRPVLPTLVRCATVAGSGIRR